MESQMDRTVQEIYYDHNVENVKEKLERNSTSRSAITFQRREKKKQN
jgi:hypothetical protein